MGVVANKRSVMMLYSGTSDYYSHRVRVVLAEKGVTVDIFDVNFKDKPQDLAELNPYNTVPTLVDRDLVLYDADVIMEYLDERFPHPPLLPVYPVARAKSRLMIHRIEKDWYSLVHQIEQGSEEVASYARKKLAEGLLTIAPVFADKPYFLSEEFTLVDCCIAPLLWRLDDLGIVLPKAQGKPILEYAQRVFNRDSFQVSLSEVEREMQAA